MSTPPPNIPAPSRWWLDSSRILRALLFVATFAALLGLFSVGDISGLVDLSPGQRSPRTVISSIDFDFRDELATAVESDRAAAAVPPVWQLDLDRFENSWRRITLLAERLAAGRAQEAVDRWNESSLYKLSAEEGAALGRFAYYRDRLPKIERLLRELASAGIVADRSELEFSLTGGNKRIVIAPGELTVEAAMLRTPSEALQAFEAQLLSTLPDAKPSLSAWRQLAADALRGNLRLDREKTKLRQDARRKEVQPVLQHISPGQAIVFQSQEVTGQSLELLRAYNTELTRLRPPEARQIEFYGRSLLMLVVLIASCGYLWSNHPQTFQSTRHLLLLAILGVMNLALVKVVMLLCSRTVLVSFAVAQFAIPAALAPMLAGVLLMPSLGVFMVAFVSVFTAIMAGDSFPLLITSMVSGFVGVYFSQNMRRRSQLVRAGAAITVAELLCIGSLAAMTHVPLDTMMPQAIAGLINGIFTIFLASGLLPVCEFLFKITTDIRLLEFSDLNHPLLKKLCLSAPGTYHHSLVVANLAESAAEAIGANPLLARVCAYYHDIGKTSHPQFFSENQAPGQNPHDRLAPTESFQILADHVRIGKELAQKYRLNQPIVDAIVQHHGTTVATSIFHKARKAAQEASTVVRPLNAGQANDLKPPQQDDFRYSNPKPSSREVAIISLADAVESASRSLASPTPDKVRALVDQIITARFEDGQLDDCSLTFHELRIVAERFTQTLLNMLHTRIAYPKDETPASVPAPSQPQQSPAQPADRQSKIA
ncbi:MAG: HDIG domain-containing protein [Verrucomicrobia bacterium]|nr:HDIG domain-containing protein [Verrucomicrobiota bacterium]